MVHDVYFSLHTVYKEKNGISISILIRITSVNNKVSGTVPDRVAQSVTCLATDSSLTADPGVESSIPARSHTFKENDHEIISTGHSHPFR